MAESLKAGKTRERAGTRRGTEKKDNRLENEQWRFSDTVGGKV